MKIIWKNIFQTALFLSIGVIILTLLYRRQNQQYQAECVLKGISSDECNLLYKIWTDLQAANFYWIFLVMVLFALTNVIRAFRWKMMFEALGYDTRLVNLFGATMIGYLVNLGIPRSGEVVKSGTLAKYENIPLEKVLGTIFTDRVFDVLMLGLVILLTLLFGGSRFAGYIDQNVDVSSKISFLYQNKILLVGSFVFVIFVMLLIWKYRKSLIKSKIAQKMVAILQGFGAGVKSVQYVSSVPLFLAQTAGIWILYYLMTYIGFLAFASTSTLTLQAALVAFTFGSLGVLIPSPGGMGSYHFLIGEALVMYGVSGSDAFSFANIMFFAIQIFVCILLGLISLIVLPIFNKNS